VHPQTAQHRDRLVVVDEDGAAIAIAAQRLGRKETGRRDVAKGADRTSLVAGAKALRRVDNTQSRWAAAISVISS
jgi:hypothetical protein